MAAMGPMKKYGFLWVTLGLFVFSVIGHWMFAWFAFVNEQQAHQQPVVVSEYLTEVLRDTLENWQSEFLQLMWQVAGLSFLFYIGSPQSKESEERLEEKIDLVLKKLDPDAAEKEIGRIERRFPKH
jgi:hypothetical protein